MDEEIVFALNKDSADTWEAVAAIQIMQATNATIAVRSDSALLGHLCHLAGFRLTNAPSTVDLKLADAYRSIDGAMSREMIYQTWLARVSGIVLQQSIQPVQFPRWQPPVLPTGEHVVLCPYPLAKLQPIPLSAWKAVVRFLRSYGLPIYLIGDPGQRADGLNFTEGCMMSDAFLLDKLAILASAKLVVGMPNAWTWLASSWQRKLAIYYPSEVPALCWYGFYNSGNHGRVEYQASQIQIPLLLAGLRQLLNAMKG